MPHCISATIGVPQLRHTDRHLSSCGRQAFSDTLSTNAPSPTGEKSKPVTLLLTATTFAVKYGRIDPPSR
jgi:hypothetical protein